MLKKLTKVKENSLNCCTIMLKGAKKRRNLAYSAISAINNNCNIRANITLIK